MIAKRTVKHPSGAAVFASCKCRDLTLPFALRLRLFCALLGGEEQIFEPL